MTKKFTLKEESDELNKKYLSSIGKEELTNRFIKLEGIRRHQLYINAPQSVDDSYNFGWMRGIALEVETLITGNWYQWLLANAQGKVDVNDIPESKVTVEGRSNSLCYRMLTKCMDILYQQGYRITDFVEWIGYALGIAWFDKPKINDELWGELYRTFNLDLFFFEPADYLSHFVAEHGQSGHLDYYPTPLCITNLINDIATNEGDRTDSQIEPCVGAAAMFLSSNKVNMVGVDLSLTMVKVSSIQAFLYKPWLLYVPKPIVGIHVDEKTMTINRYFEFNTDTRIYCGDSLLGELHAPKNIFKKTDETIKIYLRPLDLSKREIFKYEEYMYQDWDNLSLDIKKSIVVAQSREILFNLATTNPPFSANFTKPNKDKWENIEKSNEIFLAERKKRLKSYSHGSLSKITDAIIQEVELKIAEEKSKNVTEGQFELVF